MAADDTTSRRTLRWQLATVTGIRDEAPKVKTFRLACERVSAHLPGQYYVLRLTAQDGYTAQRSYSVASAPDGTATIELTVERLDDGEVSEFLHDVVVVGDELEVRGPIGGEFFAWTGEGPALLVGGGSGVVPLMAMLRHARAVGRADLLRLVVSARTAADLYYAGELPGAQTTVVLTRSGRGRLTVEDLAPLVRGDQTVFVCGSPAFCDGVTDLLAGAGVPAGTIRTERFGPSG